MPDEFGFDDDDFDFDDSFLREVDNIEAKAITFKKPSEPNNDVEKVNVGSVVSSRPLAARSSPFHRPTAAGPSRPSSDDQYDDFSFASEALAGLDDIYSSHQQLSSRTPSNGNFKIQARPIPKQGVIPSARLGMARSTSGSMNGFQTHLNFRKENQSTKGKRWDRTEFAESGRRIVSMTHEKEKGFGARQWGRDDDEEEDDMEEDFEPLVPGPKPLVDPHKPYEPQKHMPNSATLTTYVYPTNKPKRDYQYEIVQACFTDNCLVALPTGLGKTFVAGVVMLNFYRWFPTGKIVFLAPTKPLVNQQIEACQMTCGIPSSAAAVMTGSSVSASQRAKMWESRRVFYCTPQTLDNDLKNGSVDPRDIVLAVFDEAHKASGHYAYTTILAYITAHHPYFRVLALTATPGNDVPKVQAVVDALHISRIEIREAEAPDIRKYMNEKHTEKHLVRMGDVIEDFRDRWVALMQPHVKKLVDADILTERDLDMKRLKPFRLTSKRMELARDRTGKSKWAFGPLQQLEKMARAMGSLLEFSIGMFQTTLHAIAGNTTATGKKSGTKGGSAAMRNNWEFQKLQRDVDAEINSIRVGRQGRTNADRHPKMAKTLELLLAHFTQAEEDERVHGTKNDTRAMVFCSFRECVLEVVDMLNEHTGIISATKFVGQSQGKQEKDKGFNQKEQKQTIADFKEGKYNVLVSTSIGEEGLDIGEVDFVVIYDMPKQSIKLLQRIGRTGRKRDGKVHVLMSENREDTNWDAAQQTHRDIQEEILHSRNLELFEDVERLLPPGKLPDCVEEEMPVDPWNPDEGKGKKRLAVVDREEKESAKEKGKAKKQRGHEIPENGLTGFKSVADLLRDVGKLPHTPKSKSTESGTTTKSGALVKGKPAAGGRKKKVVEAVLSQSEGSEEEEDLEEVFARMERRSTSVTNDNITTRAPAKKKARAKGASDAPDIAKTTKTTKASKPKKETKAEAKKRLAAEEKARQDAKEEEEKEETRRAALDFFASATLPRRRGETPVLSSPSRSPSPARPLASPVKMAMMTKRLSVSPNPSPPDSPLRLSPEPRSPLFYNRHSPADELDESPFVLRPPGPDRSRGPRNVKEAFNNGAAGTAEITGVGREASHVVFAATKLSPTTAAMAGFSQIAPVDMSWEDDLISSPPLPPSALKSTPIASRPTPLLNPTPGLTSTPAPVDSSGNPSPMVGGRRRIMGLSRPKGVNTPQLQSTTSMDAMPPPPPPLASATISSPVISPLAATQFPVRRPGRKRIVMVDSDDTPAKPVRLEMDDSPENRLGRLKRRKDESPVRRAKKPKSRSNRAIRAYIDAEAEMSGSDASSDEPLSDHSNSSDRAFAGLNFQPTQAPRGYNQHAAYVAGLSTQAADRQGLAFRSGRNSRKRGKRGLDSDDAEDDDRGARRPVAESRVDTEGWLAKARKPVLVSDEEEEGSENEYEMGSFVCDDEEVDFASQSDHLDSSQR